MKKTRGFLLAAGFMLAMAFTFSCSGDDGNGDGGGGSSFTDPRDGKKYKSVVIGDQTWMAENLNYKGENTESPIGRCYSDNLDNCEKYGRLYSWSTAMDLQPSCNSSNCETQIGAPRQGICPDGWHLPTSAEWNELVTTVGSSTAGTKLKAKSGWNNNGNGTDDYGFSALPGGNWDRDAYFDALGYIGYWWSASENSSYMVSARSIGDDDEDVDSYSDNKSSLLSVRCVQDTQD